MANKKWWLLIVLIGLATFVLLFIILKLGNNQNEKAHILQYELIRAMDINKLLFCINELPEYSEKIDALIQKGLSPNEVATHIFNHEMGGGKIEGEAPRVALAKTPEHPLGFLYVREGLPANIRYIQKKLILYPDNKPGWKGGYIERGLKMQKPEAYYYDKCLAKNFSLRLIAESETKEKNVGKITVSNIRLREIKKWYPVSNKVAQEINRFEGIPIRRNQGKVEILVNFSKNDITWKDIEGISDSEGKNGSLVLRLSIKEEAQNRLFNLTNQNIGKFFAEVINNEIVFIGKLEKPFVDSIDLFYVTYDQLNNSK